MVKPLLGTNLIIKKITDIVVTENTAVVFDVKIQPNLLKALRLDVAFDVVAGGGQVAVEDNPYRFVTYVRLKSEEKTLHNLSGIVSYFKNKNEYGSAPAVDGALSGTPGAATYPVRFSVIMPFETIFSRAPESTVLNTNKYTTLTFETRFGNVIGAVVANSTIANATAQLVSIEREPVSLEDQNTARPENIVTRDTKDVSGAGDLVFDLPENTNIKTVMLKVVDNGVRDDDLVTDVQIVANGGSRVLRTLPFKSLQNQNKELYNLEALDTGIAMIEFDEEGTFEEMLETFNINSPQLILTTIAPTGVANVEIAKAQHVS